MDEAELERKRVEFALEQRANALATRLSQKEKSEAALQVRISTLEITLGSKEDDLERLGNELRLSKQQNGMLKDAMKEMEIRKRDWMKREEKLVGDIEELSHLLECRDSDLRAAGAETREKGDRCTAMIDRINKLEASLKEKIAEMEACKDEMATLQETLDLSESLTELQKKEKEYNLLKEQAEALENRLKEREEAELGMRERFTVVERKLMEKDKEMLGMQEEFKARLEEVNKLKLAMQEIETKRMNWKKEEDRMIGELHEAWVSAENSKAALAAVQEECREREEKCRSMGIRVEALQAAVKEKNEEVESCKEACGALQLEMRATQQENTTMRLGLEQKIRDLQEMLCDARNDGKRMKIEMEKKCSEMEELMKEMSDKDAELAASRDECKEISEKKSSLEFAVSTLQGKVCRVEEEIKEGEEKKKELCIRVESTLAEMKKSEEKVKEMEVKLENVNEMKSRIAEWKKSEERLESEVRVVGELAEERGRALECAERKVREEQEKCRMMLERIGVLEGNLRETEEAISERDVAGARSQARLRELEEEAMVDRLQFEAKVGELLNRVAAGEKRVAALGVEVKEKEREWEVALREVREKEEEVVGWREKCKEFGERNSALQFSVETLQAKVVKVQGEVAKSEERNREVCGLLASAERKAESSAQMVSELQLRMENAEQANVKMREREGELARQVEEGWKRVEDVEREREEKSGLRGLERELDTCRVEIKELEEERDTCRGEMKLLEERVLASEWTVEQLGKEVLKAKARGLQKEKDGVCVEERMGRMERRVRVALEEELRRVENEVRMRESKMKEVMEELHNAQLRIKDLMQQMLSVHSQFLHLPPQLPTLQPPQLPVDVEPTPTAAAPAADADYLELCDSLVRKNIGLERQVEGLKRKNRVILKQIEGFQSGNKSKLLAGSPEEGSKENIVVDSSIVNRLLFNDRSPLQLLAKRRKEG